MGIKAKEGQHIIKLEYKYHLLIPILISLTSFLVLLLKAIKRKGDKKC